MIHSIDIVFGNGQNFYENGRLVGYSVDSVTGNGQNFYDASGDFVGYSVDALIGSGQNYYGQDGSRSYSVDSILGGKNIYGDHAGYSVDSLFGNGENLFLSSDADRNPLEDPPDNSFGDFSASDFDADSDPF